MTQNEKRLIKTLKFASQEFKKIAFKRPLDAQPTKREKVAERMALIAADRINKVLKSIDLEQEVE